jgi:hypothetical protein
MAGHNLPTAGATAGDEIQLAFFRRTLLDSS